MTPYQEERLTCFQDSLAAVPPDGFGLLSSVTQ